MPQVERRQWKRHRISRKCRVVLGAGYLAEAVTVDLSAGGLMVEVPVLETVSTDLQIGKHVEVHVPLLNSRAGKQSSVFYAADIVRVEDNGLTLRVALSSVRARVRRADLGQEISSGLQAKVM